MFDTLGFLWLYHCIPPYLLYLLEKIVDELPGERKRPHSLRSITFTLSRPVFRHCYVFLMEAPTATADECDRNYKNKYITVFGNATIAEQKGLSAEQRETRH